MKTAHFFLPLLFLSRVVADELPPLPQALPDMALREAVETPEEVPTPEAVPTPIATLDHKEVAAVQLANTWKNAPVPPTAGINGKVVYVFGANLPSVVCSPLFATDIELEAGEIVNPDGFHLGDAVRWSVAPATSGAGENQVTHIVIKPQSAGLMTSILCATNRRTYHIKLVSSDQDWMPYVAFSYPENNQARWSAYYAAKKKFDAQNSLPVDEPKGSTIATPIEKLDFSYRIDGKAPWAPIRIYNDGVRTVLEMPKAMSRTEAPALLVVGSDKKEQLVNYRVQGERYIVDQVFEKAVLISGVGGRQRRVTITYTPAH